MAQGSGKRFQFEYEWFKSKAINASLPGNTALRELKKRYYISVLGNERQYENLADLEYRWLRGRNGVTGKYLADMWREAVIGAGGTPTNSLDENMLTYYSLT